MNVVKITTFLMALIITCAGLGMAEEMSENTSEIQTGWSGTWICGENTLSLIQNGTGVTGSYEKPKDIVRISILGNVSEDGKVLSGTWSDSANITFYLSEDGKTFNGTYVSDYTKSLEGEFDNTWNGTLISESADLDNSWTGSWDAGMNTFTNLTQDGKKVTGSYITPGGVALIIEGTISEDGKVLSGNYVNSGVLIFTLSDDGLVFNGTSGNKPDELVKDWNGTRVL